MRRIKFVLILQFLCYFLFCQESYNFQENIINNLENKIIFNIDNKIEYVMLIGKTGNLFFNYGMNTITINYYKKNEQYVFPHENHLLDKLKEIEENNGKIFPLIYFNTNMRKNIINNIIFIDSFVFSPWDSGTKQLCRVIYIITKNYNIVIEIQANDYNVVKMVIQESPEYFITQYNIISWKDFTTIETFGNDLLNNNHQSKTVKDWYEETEYILNGLKME
jgi:hypothetical protein